MATNYIQDIEFILSEVSRVSQMDIAEIRKLPLADSMAMLPHTSGQGSMLCGIKAYRRLQSIAERVTSNSEYAGRINSDTVFEHLKLIIVERFLKESRPVDQKQVARATSWALKKSANKLIDLTHYIPCHLGHTETPDWFSIGPVRFIQCKNALMELKPALDGYLSKRDADPDTGKRLLDETTKYYQSFGWVGEIKVEKCEPSVSREIADRMIQNALDCLHLFLGAAYSNHMRVGGPYFSTDKRGHIRLGPDGNVDISISVDWLSHHLSEGWWESLNQESAKGLLFLAGVAIVEGNDLSTPTPLAQRFLDALYWYGEAVRDTSQAARAIKYVTAMERVLTTKKEEDVLETFSQRGASLSFQPEDDDYSELKKRFKDIYDLRSRLVHGARSPHKSGMGQGLREAESLAKLVLLRSLVFFGEKGLNASDVSPQQLDENYETLIDWATKTTIKGD